MEQAGGVGTAGLFLFDGCRHQAGCMTQDIAVFDGMKVFMRAFIPTSTNLCLQCEES